MSPSLDRAATILARFNAAQNLLAEKLRASGQHVREAIASLTPERGSGYTVTLPYGTMSLFELADFGSGHVVRHFAQIDRTVAKV